MACFWARAGPPFALLLKPNKLNGNPQGRRPGRHRLDQAPSCAQHVRPRRAPCVGSGRRSRAARRRQRERCSSPPPSRREQQSHAGTAAGEPDQRRSSSGQPSGTIAGQPGTGRSASTLSFVACAGWGECAAQQQQQQIGGTVISGAGKTATAATEKELDQWNSFLLGSETEWRSHSISATTTASNISAKSGRTGPRSSIDTRWRRHLGQWAESQWSSSGIPFEEGGSAAATTTTTTTTS